MAQLKVVGHVQWECIAVLLLWKCTTKMLTYRGIPCVWVIHDVHQQCNLECSNSSLQLSCTSMAYTAEAICHP